MEKYINRAQLLNFRVSASQDSEGEAILKILPTCQIIECFVQDTEVEKFKKLKNRADVNTKLNLVWFDLEKTDHHEKTFIQSYQGTGVNRSTLTGQITEIKEDHALVDCGFFVSMDISLSNIAPKKGDWIKTEGRIDAFLA